MNTSYEELLERPEWHLKRQKILNRDNYTCQRCGMNTKRSKELESKTSFLKPVDDFRFEFQKAEDSRNIRMKFKKGHEGLSVKSYSSLKDLNSGGINFILFHTVLKEYVRYPFKATLGKVNCDLKIHSSIEEDPFFNRLREVVNSPRSDVDFDGIYILNYKEANKYLNTKDPYLHVHHLCYRQGIEIWEHPDEEYISLCNACHQIVHDDQEIPFFDTENKIISSTSRNKCQRCHGKGFLKEYLYYLHGICFECLGKGVIV